MEEEDHLFDQYRENMPDREAHPGVWMKFISEILTDYVDVVENQERGSEEMAEGVSRARFFLDTYVSPAVHSLPENGVEKPVETEEDFTRLYGAE